MTTTPRARLVAALACALTAAVVAALAAGALIAADPRWFRRRGRPGPGGAQAGRRLSRRTAPAALVRQNPPGYAHPPAKATPLTLQLLQPSVEPVPATDGLIHLPYVAQVTNTQPTPYDIVGVVPVDPLAGFAPTGRNLITNEQGNDVAGKVAPFARCRAWSRRGWRRGRGDAARAGLLVARAGQERGADVLRRDLRRPGPHPAPARSRDHAGPPRGGGPGTPALTNPVPVGCKELTVLRPPLIGHGWAAFNGCCTVAAYHRDAVLPVNGLPQAGEQFAIDYSQLGLDNTCCQGPPEIPSSWWGYGTPVLAAAPGVVVSVVDGMPDQQPVGTITNVPPAQTPGNSMVEDIGGGRYVGYGHLKPGSIPAWVRKGARLRPGDLIGRVGNSGNSTNPHLDFEVMDAPSPSFADATGLPFVFDTQLLEGTVPVQEVRGFRPGALP